MVTYKLQPCAFREEWNGTYQLKNCAVREYWYGTYQLKHSAVREERYGTYKLQHPAVREDSDMVPINFNILLLEKRVTWYIERSGMVHIQLQHCPATSTLSC
jgi:hypothetical protein